MHLTIQRHNLRHIHLHQYINIGIPHFIMTT